MVVADTKEADTLGMRRQAAEGMRWGVVDIPLQFGTSDQIIILLKIIISTN